VTVLVLHRGSLVPAPYDRWLAGSGEDIVLLASAERLRLYGETLPLDHPAYQHAASFVDFDSDDVTQRAMELAKRFRVRGIIACHEQDLERAAALRQLLGLPGPQPEQVVQFRDKWEMKRRLRAAGIPVADHALLADGSVLEEFAHAHGLPVVVKPRRGSGSAGLCILRDWSELAELAAQPPGVTGSGEPTHMVEAFVSGTLHHVDGLTLNGRAVTMWPFEYLFSPAAFGTDQGARRDVALEPGDRRTAPLLRFAERVLAALAPAPPDFACHLEVFRTRTGDLVLGEAAGRAPGAALREAHRVMHGIDPAEIAVRAELGFPVPEADELAPGRRPLAGEMLFMKRPGVVMALPAGLGSLPGLRWHRILADVGDHLGAPGFVSDVLAAFVVEGQTRAECLRRMDDVEAAFLDGLQIAGVTVTAEASSAAR
jgi:hypothetical protein